MHASALARTLTHHADTPFLPPPPRSDSTANGALAVNNKNMDIACNNWRANGADPRGALGDTGRADAAFTAVGNTSCDSQRALLCVAF